MLRVEGDKEIGGLEFLHRTRGLSIADRVGILEAVVTSTV